MTDLWAAFALVLVIEGVLYALFPQTMRRALAIVLTMPESNLRLGAATAVAVGVVLVWVSRF
ncbi:MAG: DUF2065 domain-containing protein [Rhodospirillaceae bacterium]